MAAKKEFDIFTMQLINNFLGSATDEMNRIVVRTSLSPITRDAHDFQCGLCMGDGEMIMEGDGTVIHSLVYQTLISEWLKNNRDQTYPGDIIITNDPYSGASHLPDVYLYRPIFVGDEIVAWSVSGGHQRDVGGMTPGSCPHNSTEIYQEGLRFSPLKLYERGVPNETFFQILSCNSRAPEIVRADIGAHCGACIIGEQRFRELIDEHSWDVLKPYLDGLLDYAERLTRAEIEAMPDGVYEFTDYLDDDGNNPGKPVPIQLKITVTGKQIAYDFTGTAPQVKGGMNNPLGSVRAAVMTALRLMINPDTPRNGGAWRPVNLTVPEGTLFNPVLPAPVASRGGTAQRAADTLIGCQVAIRPKKMMACSSGQDTLVNIAGYDRNGDLFILMETLFGGWGGRLSADGNEICSPPITNNSMIPIESNENVYPDIIYEQMALVPDTEGAGTHRGSMAVVREWRYVGDDEALVQIRVDRRDFSPHGVEDGHPGARLKATVFSTGYADRDVGKSTFTLRPNDSLRVQSAGAGGWGDPMARDPALVLDDVRNEKVSVARARKVYGVEIDEKTMKVDASKSRRLRSRATNRSRSSA